MGKHRGWDAAASRERPGPAGAGRLPERTACAHLVYTLARDRETVPFCCLGLWFVVPFLQPWRLTPGTQSTRVGSIRHGASVCPLVWVTGTAASGSRGIPWSFLLTCALRVGGSSP